jgi:hypothetical protein
MGSLIIINQNNSIIAMEPSKLKIYTGPTSVPADNSTYECIFVQLQDDNSRPARALTSTTVSLSSSQIAVGDVDPTITLPQGSTFAVAKFNSTFTPGTTTIAAAASGYGAVQTNMVTVAPVPYKLAEYGLPPIIPSDGTPYNALVVQLQDSTGSPAKAPLNGVQVTLSSSNSTIASVASSATINGGETYTLATVTSNAPGSATITALTSGYASAQATITTEQPLNVQAKSLRECVAPPVTPADNTEHQQIIVQLLSDTGKITKALTDTTIQLASSNENVGTVQPTITIPAGKVQAAATFSTTYKAGTTTITAAATDLTADNKPLTTVGPIPTKLAVYCTPSALPADNTAYNAIQVQLQDNSGKPALDPDGDVTVSLSSSDPTVGTVNATLIIPYGQTYAITTFTTTYMTSSATVTAQASGYTSSQAQVTTYVIDQAPLHVAVTANPNNIGSTGQTNITAYVTYPGGISTTGATVKFTSDNGGTFTKVTEIGNGYYTTAYAPPNFNTDTNVTITATASKTDYTTNSATTQVTIVSTVNNGTMQLCIKDDNGQPISDAIVSTLSQPTGMETLTDVTNSTGYVSFSNAIEGTYTINVNKQGYNPMNQTFTFKTTMPVLTLFITKNGDSQSPMNPTIIWLILITVIAIVVIAAAAFIQKRRTTAKFKVPKKWAPPPPPKFRSVQI